MRTITDATDAAWRSEVKAGDTRPIVRATTQRIFLGKWPYNTEDEPGGDYDHARQRTGFYRSILFGHGGAPREIPNIKKSEWSRSVDQDVATCTLTIANTQLVPLGSAESADHPDEFELPGFLAYNRGRDDTAGTRWGYDANFYTNFIMPDRMVRTYEGYGADYSVAPGDDTNLYISGTWLIDEVTYDANGDIAVAMRDIGRLLLDHISFPPIVPYADYPMEWSTIEDRTIAGREATGGAWTRPLAANTTSSNTKYVGRNISDKPPYVQANGAVQGHGDRAPMTSTAGDYWLSTGQVSEQGFVWWQVNFKKTVNLAALRLTPFGGPYKVYVSVATRDEDGNLQWQGRRTVPYRFGQEDGVEGDSGGEVTGVDVEADIRFIETVTADRGQQFDLPFRRKWADIAAVRITFTRLRGMTAEKYPFRAGLKNVKFYTGKFDSLDFDNSGTTTQALGNYRDYTDIVRWVCAWSGWWWPPSEQDNWQNFRDTHDVSDRVHYDYDTSDVALTDGRIWGTLENTGTAGITDLLADNFDKQPLMTAIQKVREVVGYQFMIDESGGVVFRRANIWSAGNYVTRDHKSTRRSPARVSSWVTVDENETLLAYETRHSSTNLRERIFVGSVNGKYGAVVRGYSPLPKTGLRRVAGWLDQNWKGKRQPLVAGDLIAAQQMFDYRRSRLTIWGNPAIQVDDQFRIFERSTNETFYHYCLSISSTLDMEAGTWDYAMESHWLGPDINEAFVVSPDELLTPTKNYMDAVGGEN